MVRVSRQLSVLVFQQEPDYEAMYHKVRECIGFQG